MKNYDKIIDNVEYQIYVIDNGNELPTTNYWHRLDGPAFVSKTHSHKGYYINDIEYTEKKFQQSS